MPGHRKCWECRKEIPYDPLRYRSLPVCDACAETNKTPHIYAIGGGLFVVLVLAVALVRALS